MQILAAAPTTHLSTLISKPTVQDNDTKRQSHGHCSHEATKAGRAWCRRQQRKGTTEAAPLATVTKIDRAPKHPVTVSVASPEQLAETTRKSLQRRSTAELTRMLETGKLTDDVADFARGLIAKRTLR